MSFAERIRQHDEKAYPLVRDALARYGFTLHRFGIELNLELQKILQKQTDKTSKMLRYRPDFIAVCPGKKSILLEIKSENKNSPNFSIEYDAWEAAKIWNKHTKNILYLFVDLAENNILASWPENLDPEIIFTYRHEDEIRLSSLNIKTKRLFTVSGSGTAFFLVSKKKLFSLDELFS